ncbi:hypothetical protein vseg_015848 [Gypsophila vaccaria]
MEHSHSHPPWADLPPELLSAIANFLTSNSNPNPNPNPNSLSIYAFRSVCNSWRSSFPPIPHPSILSPILPITAILPPSSVYTRPCSSPHCSDTCLISITIVYSLRPKEIHSNLSTSCFVLFVDEFDSGTLKIRQPFSRRSYSLPIFFPVKVNLFDYHAREIGRFFNLSYCYYYDDKQGVRVKKPRFRSEDVLKVVLFCDGSAAVALFHGGKLGLIRLDLGVNVVGKCRSSGRHWDVIHGGKGFQFDDIVEYKGRVMGVDRRGRVYLIGRSSSEINLVVRSSSIGRGSGRRKRLVESLGGLYLVVRYNVGDEMDGIVTFKVYELNIDRRKWVEVKSIGDRVFFFGIEFAFSSSGQDVSCGKNCILFKQNSFRPYSGDDSDDSEAFGCSQSDDLFVGVCHLDHATHVGAIESYSGFLDGLWPPPAWIWPVDKLERLGIIEAAFDEIFMKLFKKFEIKLPELTVEKGGYVSYDVFQQIGGAWDEIINDILIGCARGVDIWTNLQRLKKLVNKIKVAEENLIHWDKTLQAALSMNGRSVFMDLDLLSQIEGSLTPDTTMEKLNWLAGEIKKSATVDTITNDGRLLDKIRDVLGNQNRVIFHTEECASDLVCHYYSIQSLAEESSSTNGISNA